jgi:hypothetical protein
VVLISNPLLLTQNFKIVDFTIVSHHIATIFGEKGWCPDDEISKIESRDQIQYFFLKNPFVVWSMML